MDKPPRRRLLTAEVLSIGTELTVGETRDTNAGELARELHDLGLTVVRLSALPDRLEAVARAISEGLEVADLVVCTGGLGPTPDDLTREAIAAVCGETPTIDEGLASWLRELWDRRGLAFPAANLKQAWLIPSATAISNPNGTAPGWWVERPGGRLIVALPGPPREMRPLWHAWVVPRLRATGAGETIATRTFRLAGIGESQVAHLLGENLLRESNPVVATYARNDAVDVRVSARDEILPDGRRGRTAAEIAARGAEAVLAVLSDFVWAEGTQTWAEAIGARLEALGWRLSVIEIDTGGSLASLLGDAEWVSRTESRRNPDEASAAGPAPRGAGENGTGNVHEAAVRMDPATSERGHDRELEAILAEKARVAGSAEVGLAVVALPQGADTTVRVAIQTPISSHRETRTVFLGGSQGRSRAGLAGAAILNDELRSCAARLADEVSRS